MTDSETQIVDETEANVEPEQVDEPDTFPRTYVEELRKENARYRERAKATDEVAQRLHAALVAADGRLADPTDLAYDGAHLDDPEALRAAIDALIEAKPHLADRRPTGDVGQGARPGADSVGLGGILRARV